MIAAYLWLLRGEVSSLHPTAIANQLRQISPWRLIAAVVLTALSYGVLASYDALGVVYLKLAIPIRRALVASVASYAVSNSTGVAALSGSGVRYRIYSEWGCTVREVLKMAAFTGATFWLGFLAVSGGVLIIDPTVVPISMPSLIVRLVGCAGLSVTVGYVVSCARQARRELPTARWLQWLRFLPSWRIAVAQLVLGSLDWIVSAAALAVLIGNYGSVTFVLVLGAYLSSQLLAIVTFVPGGVGVFELTMVLLLHNDVPTSSLVGALVAYRVIYYLLPLASVVITMGSWELSRHHPAVRVAVAAYRQTVGALIPGVLAALVFAAGLVLILSSALPAISHRLHALDGLPLFIIELSQFASSVIGAALLLVARGLQQRLATAFAVTVALLVTGMATAMMRGLDFEEAMFLGVVLVALLPIRSHFYRRTAFTSDLFSPRWIVSVAVAVFAFVWLGFLAYRDVPYSNSLWFTFGLEDEASRFLRSTVGVSILLLFVSIASLVRHEKGLHPDEPTPESWLDIQRIVRSSPDTYAHLALLGDKRFLFNERRTAFIMFQAHRRSWIAMGDPVGPRSERRDLIWSFRRLCSRHGVRTVFYEVSTDSLSTYLDLGLSPFKIGEEAHVSLARFSLAGNHWKNTRNVINRLEREGYRMSVIPAGEVPTVIEKLQAISDDWLANYGRELGFSLGSFSPAYVMSGPVALVLRDDEIVAFANLWQSADRAELSPDLMRYATTAPTDVIQFLFVQLMKWGQAEGFTNFNLGMAPLAGLETDELAPFWQRIGGLVYSSGDRFYRFDGLRKFKQKFAPDWTPRYLVVPSGIALPTVLADLYYIIRHVEGRRHAGLESD